MSETRSGCGLEVPGATVGCQAIFDRLMARTWSDPSSFRIHRLMVDSYSVQHPERYCASAKSLIAPLGGLCCHFDHGSIESAIAVR